MIKPLAHVLTMLALLALTACSTPRPANEGDVQKLAIEIQALGPEIVTSVIFFLAPHLCYNFAL